MLPILEKCPQVWVILWCLAAHFPLVTRAMCSRVPLCGLCGCFGCSGANYFGCAGNARLASCPVCYQVLPCAVASKPLIGRARSWSSWLQGSGGPRAGDSPLVGITRSWCIAPRVDASLLLGGARSWCSGLCGLGHARAIVTYWWVGKSLALIG